MYLLVKIGSKCVVLSVSSEVRLEPGSPRGRGVHDCWGGRVVALTGPISCRARGGYNKNTTNTTSKSSAFGGLPVSCTLITKALCGDAIRTNTNCMEVYCA